MVNFQRPTSGVRMNISGLRVPEMKTFECGIHHLSYEAYDAGCPVCSLERDNSQLRRAVQQTRQQMEMLSGENMRLKVQVDIVYAIREAAELLDDDDLAFLKATLYEWRDVKAVVLKTTHGGGKVSGRRRNTAPPNGFIAMPRSGDPYGHACTSVGGLAIAEYFEEANGSVGPAKAMELLVKGMALHLPGAAT